MTVRPTILRFTGNLGLSRGFIFQHYIVYHISSTLPITEESGIVTRAGQEETREAKAEMGGLCKERCEEGRRGGGLELEKKTGDRGGWRSLADEAVKKLQASPHP